MVVAIPVPLNKLSKKSIALHIKQLAQLGNIEEYYEKAGTKVQKTNHTCVEPKQSSALKKNSGVEFTIDYLSQNVW